MVVQEKERRAATIAHVHMHVFYLSHARDKVVHAALRGGAPALLPVQRIVPVPDVQALPTQVGLAGQHTPHRAAADSAQGQQEQGAVRVYTPLRVRMFVPRRAGFLTGPSPVFDDVVSDQMRVVEQPPCQQQQ